MAIQHGHAADKPGPWHGRRRGLGLLCQRCPLLEELIVHTLLGSHFVAHPLVRFDAVLVRQRRVDGVRYPALTAYKPEKLLRSPPRFASFGGCRGGHDLLHSLVSITARIVSELMKNTTSLTESSTSRWVRDHQISMVAAGAQLTANGTSRAPRLDNPLMNLPISTQMRNWWLFWKTCRSLLTGDCRQELSHCWPCITGAVADICRLITIPDEHLGSSGSI